MSRKSQGTTGPNVDIPSTTESDQGESPHDSNSNGADLGQVGGAGSPNGRANRRLCRLRPAGAPDWRYPATFQAQYSGQSRLRYRRVAGTAFPRTARTVRGISGPGPV